MMQKVSEMTTEPIVGKYYLVECVRHLGEWVAVIGDSHKDAELGADYPHIHLDMRFLSAKQEARLSITRVIYDVPDINGRTLLKVRCKRAMPEFPFPPPEYTNSHNIWTRFAKQFVGRKAKCGKCPHRGMPLESLPKREDGTVICNGHGLKIDMNKQEGGCAMSQHCGICGRRPARRVRRGRERFWACDECIRILGDCEDENISD